MTPRSALHSAAHSTFVIERRFAAPVARVFAAWSDPQQKRRWSACHDDWATIEYALDFRVGGVEVHAVAPPGGRVHRFTGRFLDIVPAARIVYAYDMLVGEARISVSLATVSLAAEGARTRMTFTEQVVLLDGHGDADERREGTEVGLDRLAALLA